MTTPLLGSALAVVEQRGWPVFLLGRGKRPLSNCRACPKRDQPGAHDPEACGHLTCHGFYSATRDPGRLAAMVAEHPDGMLAVRTGAAPAGAGVVAIDIDPRSGGRLDPDLMTPTLTVATGGHGWHLYYRHPGRPVLSRKLPRAAGVDVAGVDVKGDGGYCVLPPSVHPTTRLPYRWCEVQRPIADLPPRLAEMVLAPSPAQAGPGAVTPLRVTLPGDISRDSASAIKHPRRLVDSCLLRVRTAPEGQRRTTLYGAARGIARVILAGHLTTDTGIALLTDAGRHAAQTDRDIRAAIIGGFVAEGLTVLAGGLG